MPTLTPEQQLAVINDPAFRDAIQGRVLAALAALAQIEASAPELAFAEQSVPVRVRMTDPAAPFFELQIGLAADGRTPLFDWRAPVRWFEHREAS